VHGRPIGAGMQPPPPGEHSLTPAQYMEACYDALCANVPRLDHSYSTSPKIQEVCGVSCHGYALSYD
jgi:hypothetical protein